MDKKNLAKICWKESHKYVIADREYVSGLDVVYTLSKHSKLRLTAQCLYLSYWNNGVLTQEGVNQFLEATAGENSLYLGDGTLLGENPLPLVKLKDLETHPTNIGLLITGTIGAQLYHVVNDNLIFYLNNNWSSVPFGSHVTFEKPKEAQDKAMSLLKNVNLIWSGIHSYKHLFEGETLVVGNCHFSPTFKASDKKKTFLTKLNERIKIVNNPKAIVSIQNRIKEIEETPAEEFGYLPAIKIEQT